MKQNDKTNEEKDTNDMSSTGDESEDGQNSTIHRDQDSDVSFENDAEEEAQTMPWKRWKMRRFDAGIRRNELTLALREATSPSERWLMKAAEWNPEFAKKTMRR